MKNVLKKICKYSLFSVFMIALLFITNIKTEASWGGSSTLDTYEQTETDMRAVWVATVGNLNINPQNGKGEGAINLWKESYLEILDTAEASNLNTIIFQIRPANDAFYPSKYNPWSTYLTTDGSDPGWDPVAWMIEVTHARGMEYHAWLNPYRASVGTLSINLTSKDPVTGIEKIVDVEQNKLNDYKTSYFANLKSRNPGIDNPVFASGEELYHNVVLGSEGKFILNPASPTVRQHIYNTIEEIVDNYEIDGIHFDDYFYPNDAGYAGSNENYKGKTYSSEPYYDQFDYNNYLLECSNNGVQSMNVYDWRRENVNILIKDLGELIRTKNANKQTKCAFGISPAARWAPTKEVCSSEPYRGAEGGMSDSCNNYYSYSDLFADTYKWAKEEWIDYIVPQNYTNLAGDYGTIMKWWSDALKDSDVKLYVGTALYQVSNSWGDSGVLEMYYQVRYNQTKDFRVDGYFLFSYSSMTSKMGANAMKPIAQYAWKYAALTPLYKAYTYDKLVKEKSRVEKITLGEDNLVTVDYSTVEDAKGYGVYKVLKGEEVTFDIKNLVAREINPNTLLEFKKDEAYDYYLVTYDNDNTIYQDYELIELDNEAPVVSVSIDKESYYSGQELAISLSITDTDDTFHNVVIKYAADGKTFIHTVYEGGFSTSTSNNTVKFTLPSRHSADGMLYIVVKDALNTVEKNITVPIKYALPDATISFNKDAYAVDDIVTFTLNLNDPDSDSFTVSALYAADGVNYTETILSEATVSGDSTMMSFYLAECSVNSLIKVIITDDHNTVEKIFSLNVVNSKPTVSITNVSNGKVGDSANIVITSEDVEGDNLSYTVYITYDGKNYKQVLTGSISSKTTIANISLEEASEKAIIKVEVSDGTNKVEVLSNNFVIEGAKKGCGCGKDAVMFEVLAIITLLAFVLRKRER